MSHVNILIKAPIVVAVGPQSPVSVTVRPWLEAVAVETNKPTLSSIASLSLDTLSSNNQAEGKAIHLEGVR